MASIEFDGIDEYIQKLGRLADPKTIEAACRYAIYPAAGFVADEIKKATPIGHDPATGMPTGDLAESVCIAKMETEDGVTSATVTFAGYDRNGTPNAIKARVLESGNSHVRGRHFVRKTVQRIRNRAIGLMDAAFSHYIYEKYRK